jgi:Mg2+/citrate symporter
VRTAANCLGAADAGMAAALGARAAAGRDNADMWLILIEALAAGLILVLIVWWTMFSGRRGGERVDDDDASDGR